MNIDKFLYDVLIKLNVDYSFGIPGASIMPWYNFLYENKEIEHVTTSHENSAGYMAMHYALVTKKLGMCCTTTGPGVTNIATGVAAAFSENIPILVITGEVRRKQFGMNAYQESTGFDHNINSVDIMKPICKASQQAVTGMHFARLLINFLGIAFSDTKGPVHISVPFNVWNESISDKLANNLIKSIKYDYFISHCSRNDLNITANHINKSLFPALLLGRGVILSNAGKKALEFAKKINIPIITTTRGKGSIPTCEPYNLGQIGQVPTEIKNKYIEKIDLLIAVGTSLSYLSIGEKFTDTKTIHISLNSSSSGNLIDIRHRIIADSLYFFINIFEENINKKKTFSIYENKTVKDNNYYLYSNSKKLTSDIAISTIENSLSEETRILPDAGSHWIWSMKYLSNRRFNGFYSGRSLGGMGQAIAGSIGISLALSSDKIVCITGDGSFLMQGNDIVVASQRKCKILFILFNDSAYGRIYHAQKKDFGGKIIGTVYPEYNFKKIADAFKLLSVRVTCSKQLKLSIENWEKDPKPTLIEIIIDRDSGLPT